MRPGVNYSSDELIELSKLHDRTNEAAEELEESFMEIQERLKLSEKEVLFTLARVADSFIRMHEEYNFNHEDNLDAEAAFNDYCLACRDIRFVEDSDDDMQNSAEKGN